MGLEFLTPALVEFRKHLLMVFIIIETVKHNSCAFIRCLYQLSGNYLMFANITHSTI